MSRCVCCGEEFGKFEKKYYGFNGLVCSRCFEMELHGKSGSNKNAKLNTKKESLCLLEFDANFRDSSSEIRHSTEMLENIPTKHMGNEDFMFLKEENRKRQQSLNRLRLFIALIALLIVILVSYPGIKNLYQYHSASSVATTEYSENYSDIDEINSLLKDYVIFLGTSIKTIIEKIFN